MFFGKRMLLLTLVALIGFGLLGMVGSSAYRTGWAQGYYVGQAAAGGEEGAAPAVPYAPYGPYGRHAGPGWGLSPFWGIGLLFKFFLFLLVLGAIGRFFFRRHGGRWHGPDDLKGKHDHWRYGWRSHKPPWAWDQDEAEESTMKA